MKRVMIAGTKSGVGKTTISMGLMAALTRKMTVQPYKVGPDYIDSAYHSYITGNICRNLDSFLLNEEMIKFLFNRSCINGDISVVEGVMGLFDGAEVGSDVGTSASIAKILNIPVILVVDGSKVASSLAATVKGFELFDKDLKISGVIINNVGSVAHYELLKSAIEFHTDVEPCGYLIKNSSVSLPERHLGLVPVCEQPELDNTLSLLANLISETVDISRILEIAQVETNIEKVVPKSIKATPIQNNPVIRIAIARDSAFNFYYQDSLELLSLFYNVEWIPYSPISDDKLPEDIHGLYIGGGFPEVFAQKLSDNITMKKDLLNKLDQGLPYIAECGGLMYLCESLTDLDGGRYEMIGWLKGHTVMTKKLQRFGYAGLTLEEDCILGSKGDTIKTHEFHRSKAEIEHRPLYRLEKIRNNKIIKEWKCGYIKKAGIAGYAHLHFGSNICFGKSFVEECQKYKKGSRNGLHKKANGD